ncbi:hypothetical protein [Mumia sp. Pv 4-285]|uniref:hypothetical protein n=1 Tax=Mumia qirimensis TaxID=3234852 RepID=UPI00351D1F07
MSRRGLDPLAFVKATAATRVVASAWFLLFALVFLVGLIGILHPDIGPGSALGFLSGAFGQNLATLLGFASLLAIVGPGYTEYREGMAAGLRT